MRFSGCGSAPRRRCDATMATTPARASAVGTSPWMSWNASRSWAPTPTSRRVTPRSGSTTTRHTSSPATSPETTPCSITGVAPPASIRGVRASNASSTGGDGSSATGSARRNTRPSAIHTTGGVVKYVARRASTPAATGSSATTFTCSVPCWRAHANAGPRARSGRSSASTQAWSPLTSAAPPPKEPKTTGASPAASRTRAPSFRPSSALRRCGSGVTWGSGRPCAGRTGAVEALDAATGVDQLLLAGEERVALVAELDVELAALVDRVVNVLPHEQRTVVSM